MNRTISVLMSVLLLVFADSANAQVAEKVLIPVWSARETPGAFGSRWVTELSVLSRNGLRVIGLEPEPCNLACVPVGLPVNKTISAMLNPLLIGRVGAFVFAPPDPNGGDDASFQLRVRDLSRQAENWGTEIPVVRERSARTGVVTLLDLPVEEHFRHNLRIYDFDAGKPVPARVRVRVYAYKPETWDSDPPAPPGSDDVVFEDTLGFTVDRTVDSRFDVGHIEINFVSSLASWEPGERMRVDIEPITAGLRLWAFVTITNNTTQQVTVVTPQ